MKKRVRKTDGIYIPFSFCPFVYLKRENNSMRHWTHNAQNVKMHKGKMVQNHVGLEKPLCSELWLTYINRDNRRQSSMKYLAVSIKVNG